MRIALVTVLAALALAAPASARINLAAVEHDQHHACTAVLHGTVEGTWSGEEVPPLSAREVQTECFVRGHNWILFGDHPVLGRVQR